MFDSATSISTTRRSLAAFCSVALIAGLLSACGPTTGAAADAGVVDDAAVVVDGVAGVAADGAAVAAAPVLATGLDCPLDLEVDDTDVYVVVHAQMAGDDVPMDIMRAPKDGSGAKYFVAKRFLMTRLALDATHVYWNQIGTSNNGAVRRMLKGGKTMEDFAVLRPSTVWDLALDKDNVYWGGYEIARQNKLATTATQLGYSPIAGTRAFVIDATYAYFSVGDDKMLIARVPLAGGVTSMVVPAALSPTNTSYMAAKQLAVDATYLYWTADLKGGLHRIAKDGSGAATVVFPDFPNDRRFVIDGPNLYWAEDSGDVKWALTDGTGAVHTLYSGSPINGIEGGFPLGVDANRVYWAYCGGIRSAPKAGMPPDGTSSGADAGSTDSGTSHYQVSASGNTVLDTATQLTWQRQISATFNLTEAGGYCGSMSLDGGGWRVPTRVELNSIVEPGKNQPAIDVVAFPGTFSEPFWTSTLDTAVAGQAWSVDFGFGVNFSHAVTFPSRVRCVR
jgi:hypothetical protein